MFNFRLLINRCPDRLVVRTLRCGRSNPVSNPGHGKFYVFIFIHLFIYFVLFFKIIFYLFRFRKENLTSLGK